MMCIEVFWQTAAAQHIYLPYPTLPYHTLPNLTWVFNLQPPVPEADALQLEVS